MRHLLRVVPLAALAVACGNEVGGTPGTADDVIRLEDWVPPESFTDEKGVTWVRTERVEYDYSPDVVLPAQPEEGPALPDPRTVTDLEWAKLWEPLGELGGWEYRLTDESLLEYGRRLRTRAAERAEHPERTYGAPSGRPRDPDQTIAQSLPDQPQEGLIEKGIVGRNDNRIIIDHLRNDWPYSMHGAMQAPLGGGSNSYCTAFKVINQETAGTAAHCVHTGSSWKPRAYITFYDGNRGRVHKDCYFRSVNGNWTDFQLPKNDYAVIAFRKYKSTAWCEYDTFDFGWFGWHSVNYTENTAGFVSGYPAPGTLPPTFSGTPTWPHLVYHYADDAEVGVVQSRVLKYYNDTTGGQSGSPFVTWTGPDGDWYVRAIHKGDVEFTAFVDYNQGREFDSNVADFMEENGGSWDPDTGVIVQ